MILVFSLVLDSVKLPEVKYLQRKSVSFFYDILNIEMEL